MTDTVRNLEKIERGYTTFEKDQVLTPEQLNSLSGYLGDQERLTRVALLGVGIACGLWATLDGKRVRLSHGVGTTTDGDLVYVPEPAVYDRYKPYDRSAPKYPPFYTGAEQMIAAYELVREGEEDSRAFVLSGFEAREGRDLEAMVAVLYVESCLLDEDLCTGTDCDNRGKQAMHTLRLLLVEREAAAALAAPLETPDGAASTPLLPVVAARPQLPGAALGSSANLAAVYRAACATTHERLVAAFKTFYPKCRPFVEDLFAAEPGTRWTRSLEQIRDATADIHAQYYYDFLKDLADTYNAFLDTLFGDAAVCCPDLEAFSKHLVLGALDPAQGAASGRTGFYPSPMVSATFEQRARARFLLRKIDTLIVSFAPARDAPAIRITPSAFEDRALESRAIPFYYVVRDDAPIYQAWNYALSRRGMARHNYGYYALELGEGAARAPLQAQLGAFDFFRIEGHVGRSADAVKKIIDPLIRTSNLPIDVEYVRFDKPPRGWRPPRRFNDVLRFHHLLRADVSLQLADVNAFGETFVSRVTAAAAGNDITDEDNHNVPVVGTAQAKKERLAVHAGNARQKIEAELYDPRWREDVAQVSQAAVELHEAFSPVTKKEFVTPLDQVIAGQPARWLGWLDDIIDDAQDKEAERARLSQFLAEHPGLEHCAGVPRGGTFVMVCDAQDIVVADFMLPYSCCEERAEPPKPPKLLPPLRPPVVLEKPIRLVPFPDKFRFTKFKDEFVKGLEKELDFSKKYLDGLKDTISIFAGGKAGAPTLPSVTLPAERVTDPVLSMHLVDTTVKSQKLDLIRVELLDPSLDEAKRGALETQLKTTEAELANAIVATTEYVAGANLAVEKGTEARAAMSAATTGLAKLNDLDALTRVEMGLTTVSERPATAPEVKTVIGSMLGSRLR